MRQRSPQGTLNVVPDFDPTLLLSVGSTSNGGGWPLLAESSHSISVKPSFKNEKSPASF